MNMYRGDLIDVFWTVENGTELTFDGTGPKLNTEAAFIYGTEPEEYYWAMHNGRWLMLKKSEIKPLDF